MITEEGKKIKRFSNNRDDMLVRERHCFLKKTGVV
jgi:hypothetical protein